ncbi:MAG: hypothetical protein IPM84_03380 [Anaerolineae bacterium]|nr:hypothetical protein [Anaerolineae bacterium]
MPVSADTLRSIKTFPDLVRYLEDELDWPLQEYGFDELTFEYSPAELGAAGRGRGQSQGDPPTAADGRRPTLRHLFRGVRAQAHAGGGAP